jgi:hypothetical protein
MLPDYTSQNKWASFAEINMLLPQNKKSLIPDDVSNMEHK